jgi:hypothetical protein
MFRRLAACRFVVFGFVVAMGAGCAAGSSGSEGFDTTDTGSATDDVGGDGFTLDSSTDETPVATDTGATTEDTGATTVDSGTASETSGTETDPGDTSSTDAASDAAAEASDSATSSDAASDGAADAAADTGGDGATTGGCTCADDSDGDGIPDNIEGRCAAGGATDTDGDGTPDYLDLDSDGDGIPDRLEWFEPGCDPTGGNDADGDGIPNFRDLDSDGNGLLDSSERCPPASTLTALSKTPCPVGIAYDFDTDGIPDFLDPDNDHDSVATSKFVGLDDRYELTDKAGTYVGLVDSDGDGIPDLYDVDSDNDTILDSEDGINDVDGDGKQNFRDTDSDGDGVLDSCEKKVDTDGDGKADYVDLDSDGDLLLDKDEDKDGNCIIGATETDRLKKDTDGDGVDDLIEVTLIGAAGAKDATSTPAKAGKFYFVVPYSADGSAAPTPTSSPLALSTKLNKGDVGFVVDTTYSMNGAINNLKSSIASTIIPSLAARIPDLGIGVMGHDDVPNVPNSWTSASGWGTCQGLGSPYFLPPDEIFYIPTNGTFRDVSVGGVISATGQSQAQAAVNALRRANGMDLPESQIPALLHAIRGDSFSWTGTTCPSGSRAAVAPTATTFGALGFRKDALPIMISVSDARFHGGRYPGSGAYHYPYVSPGGSPAYSVVSHVPPSGGTAVAPNIDTLVTAIKAANARFMGVATADASTADTDAAIRVATSNNSAYGDMAYLTDNTNSNVPTSAFGTGSTTCKTGIGGATLAADGPGGTCRLIFSVRKDGTGLGTSVVDGVLALLNAIKFDVHVQAIPDPGPVDSVNAFMEKVEPSPAGGTDPVTGGVCVTFSSTALVDRYNTPKALSGAGDIKETITGLNPGPLYCFNVVPKPNTTVLATTSVQTFKAKLRVLAENGTTTLTLGADREVLFLVPPIAN